MNKSIVNILLSVAIILPVFVECSTPKTRVILDHPNLRRFSDHHINNIIIMAWEHVSKNNFESAALDFERLIKKGYVDDDICFGAAISYYYSHKKAKALEYCNAALEKNSIHFEALFLRAQIYTDIGKAELAYKDYRELSSMDFRGNLICGYYFFENDIANKKAFDLRKKAAIDALKSF